MDEAPLTPIRTPLPFYWREFRIRVLPYMVFIVLIAGILVVWRYADTSNTIPAVGEGARAAVSSLQPGVVLNVFVAPYQMVEAGDILAVVQPRDAGAQLDLLRLELQLAQLRSQPSIAEGNAMNFERIRVELLRTKSELEVARVNLQQADAVVRRNLPLFQEKLVSEEIFDLATATRNMYFVEVQTKSNAVAEIESRLESLRGLGEPVLALSNAPPSESLARLDAIQREAITNWVPMTLVAPISGMVSGIIRQPGESILEGEPLLYVSAGSAHRIVGYMRQPYTVNPKVGMEVQVVTRDPQRQIFTAAISQVGSQVEVVTNALARVVQGLLVDVGLPIVVDVPQNVQIRPGEIVDIRLSQPGLLPKSDNPTKTLSWSL